MDGAAGGLAVDLALYGLSAAFAAITAGTSTLAPHRAWGTIATIGYAVAATVVVGQLISRRRGDGSTLAGTPARAALTVLTWAATALLPMLIQSIQRAGGSVDRAQEEVVVVENGGARLLHHGTPYLGHDAIAALPESERLLGYLPYQPGMALFGLPRAVFGTAWWTDARLWFAVVAAVALALAVGVLRRSATPAVLVRAVQAVTVLPLWALTLATGGDDLPVLALCLLALALCARSRFGAAGVAVGVAGALKLFAWPVALVLLVHVAWRQRWRGFATFAAGAIGIPVATIVPAVVVDPDAATENVVRFPLGRGLVESPAQSPFPGHAIATGLPDGRVIAAALLVAAGVAIAGTLVRRPPRTAASTALFCAYGLLAAILLMPSTRFGYLLYPVAFLAWAPALRVEPLGEPPSTVRNPGAGRRPALESRTPKG
ncbi:MAG TPA: glycosyltransferase 87 family protein [Micromonosporaceae bacterium]|jgi:hypothetical protein